MGLAQPKRNPSDGVIVSESFPEQQDVNDQQSNLDQADNDNGSQDNSGGHPAWQPILDQVPEELHGLIRPELEKWDRGVQEKIQGLHSEYEPFRELQNQGISPDQMNQALQFVSLFDQDPEGVIRQAIEHYGLDLGQGDPDDDDYDDDDYDDDEDDEDNEGSDRRYRQLQQRQDNIEEQLSRNQQEQLDAQADDALDEYLDELEEQYGAYDEQYVLSLMTQGVPGDQAVQQFQYLYDRYGSDMGEGSEEQGQNGNGQQAPIVSGAGGTTGSGLPSGVTKPGDLSDAQVESLVEQLLAKQQQQG